jgi:hypothetical protein
MLRIAPRRLLIDQAAMTAQPSPDTGAANTLFTFMAQRFVASWQTLDCADLITEPAPINLKTNSDGVTTAAQIDAKALKQAIQKLAPQKAEDDQEDSVARSQGATE